ncbi:hypothetical protein SPI_07058 [Niveomyces insectorum RCEF 264]|uniref:Uncharacterized protein n=1 Tax=Niveomyces insectorum RCEF 264 TaxID=1081102 RepID=A0A167Q8F8_9HYPO|nr:hypothetical protein SPI_07058 [Niveomyces insectorum RCEF 264]
MAGNDEIKPPSPAEAFKLASNYAALLRALCLHPQYYMLEGKTATAQFVPVDAQRTPLPLLYGSQFAQDTYIKYVIPFLPQGATRKCKDIANPWAWSDPNYAWEWEWDAAAGVLKDTAGNAIEFPKLRKAEAMEKLTDILSRGFMIKKIILENETDPRARMMLGGASFDFDEEAKNAARNLD